MAKAPAFQFYTRDWLASSKTRRMTLAERGLYIEMLAWQFEDGAVPDDPAEIAAMVAAPVSDVEAAWPKVRALFEERAGTLVNLRLERARKEWKAFKKERSESGKRGAEVRHKRRPAKRQPVATMEDDSRGSAIAEPKPASATASASTASTATTASKNEKSLVREIADGPALNTKEVVRSLHEHFCQKRGGRPLKLTKDRAAKYAARLRTFKPDELITAMDNALDDPFYRGDNDRGTDYSFPETILKNDAAVARHLERGQNGKHSTFLNRAAQVRRALD